MSGSRQPGIIYALVARGNTILAEYTGVAGNFATVTVRILNKIPPVNAKMTYVYDKYAPFALVGGYNPPIFSQCLFSILLRDTNHLSL
jgi:hypothetical protein